MTRTESLLQVRADVLEDLAHDRAKEQKGGDHDDRNEGEKQTVLDERLTFLIPSAEPGEKRADELKHEFALPPFLRDWRRQATVAIQALNMA